jgi:Cu-processing system permease protein
MSPVVTIAAKEIQDGLRNRWIIGTTMLLAALALTLAFLGSAPAGVVKASALAATVVSLSSLTIYLLPLIALLLSHDTIIGEIERGTMALLLAYPVARWQVISGKFLGHAVILAIATTIGYGSAGAAIMASGAKADPQAWPAFIAMIGTSILLGAAFVSIGYLLSAVASESAAAAGGAIGVWLFFVMIYDMAVLGLLVADGGKTVTVAVLNWLLLFNPADVYRLFNLTGFSQAASFAGMAGVVQDAQLSMPVLLTALAGWIVVPLSAAVFVFGRKQV